MRLLSWSDLTTDEQDRLRVQYLEEIQPDLRLLAIRATLSRVGNPSPIVNALPQPPRSPWSEWPVWYDDEVLLPAAVDRVGCYI